MIIKLIERQTRTTSNFGGLVRYLTDPQGKEHRVGEVRLMNYDSSDVVDALQETKLTQAKNERAESADTMHLVVSFAPGEVPSADVIDMIQSRILNSLGMQEHQCLSVVHQDTDALHLHMAVNKIHPTTFRMISPSFSWTKLGQCCVDCERDYGLVRTNHVIKQVLIEGQTENVVLNYTPDEHYIRNQKTRDMDFRIESESLTRFLKDKMKEPLYEAKTWDDFHRLLAENGLRLREQGNGFVFQSTGSGINVKASSVSRGFSKSALEKRLGPMEPSVYVPKGIVRQPQRNPQLFAQYKASRPPRPDFKAQYEAIREKGRLERLKMNERFSKDMAYASTIRNRLDREIYCINMKRIHAQELEALKARQKKEREAVRKPVKRQTWPEWLQQEAARGNLEALIELRKRDERLQRTLTKTARSLTGKAPPKLYLTELTREIDSVTKHGTIIYRCGETTVRDTGELLCVDDGYNTAVLQSVLAAAKDKFQGTGLTINGTDEFRNQVLIAASQMKEDLTFDDPALQTLYLQLKEESYGRKRTGRYGIDAYESRNRGHGSRPLGSRDSVHGKARRRNRAARPETGESYSGDDRTPGERLRSAGKPDGRNARERLRRCPVRDDGKPGERVARAERKAAGTRSVYTPMEALPRSAYFAIIARRRSEAADRGHDLPEMPRRDVVAHQLAERKTPDVQMQPDGVRTRGEHG